MLGVRLSWFKDSARVAVDEPGSEAPPTVETPWPANRGVCSSGAVGIVTAMMSHSGGKSRRRRGRKTQILYPYGWFNMSDLPGKRGTGDIKIQYLSTSFVIPVALTRLRMPCGDFSPLTSRICSNREAAGCNWTAVRAHVHAVLRLCSTI